MLWQLEQVTSLRECLPDSQNASWRLPPWQVMQTAVFSAGVPCLILFSGLVAGSFKCADASPWHAWHIPPSASFFAPWCVMAIEVCLSSWQVAHTGLLSGFAESAGDCANAGTARSAAR